MLDLWWHLINEFRQYVFIIIGSLTIIDSVQHVHKLNPVSVTYLEVSTLYGVDKSVGLV